MRLFILLVFIAFRANAYVANMVNTGLGLESLMLGVGQARTGSTGALNSNPALLGWLEKKADFTSTNSLSLYKLKSEDGGDYEITPEVIPLFAATSEGFENWGHSYGLIISSLKLNYAGTFDGYSAQGTSETQEIGFSYGFGRKLSTTQAIGLSVFLKRTQEESNSSSQGESSGIETAVSARRTHKFWSQGIGFGWAGKYDRWSVGASAKFNLAKFSATARNDISGYTEATNSNFKQIDHKLEPIQSIPIYGLGVKREFVQSILFFDLYWVQSYFDKDSEEYTESVLSGAIGYEYSINEVYRMYSAIGLPVKDMTTENPVSLALGLSKKGKHSENYAGIDWSRNLESSEAEVIRVNFGTIFDY